MSDLISGIAERPFVGFHFKVEFHDSGSSKESMTTHRASFQEVSGLTSQINIEEVKEGGENTYSHRLPMPAKFGNLVLKRGMLYDDDLVKWVRSSIDTFQFTTKNVFVKLLNPLHQPVQTWNFEAAYPVKWSVSGFNSTANAVVVESIELAYKKFTVVENEFTLPSI